MVVIDRGMATVAGAVAGLDQDIYLLHRSNKTLDERSFMTNLIVDASIIREDCILVINGATGELSRTFGGEVIFRFPLISLGPSKHVRKHGRHNNTSMSSRQRIHFTYSMKIQTYV